MEGPVERHRPAWGEFDAVASQAAGDEPQRHAARVVGEERGEHRVVLLHQAHAPARVARVEPHAGDVARDGGGRLRERREAEEAGEKEVPKAHGGYSGRGAPAWPKA